MPDMLVSVLHGIRAVTGNWNENYKGIDDYVLHLRKGQEMTEMNEEKTIEIQACIIPLYLPDGG